MNRLFDAQVVDNGRSGFVVSPGSENEISETVIKLLSNRALVENLKHEARKEVEDKYSNVILGKNFKTLYKDALK